MRSTDHLRLVKQGRIAVLVMAAVAFGLQTGATDSPKIVFRAAAAQGKSGIQVRLRWSLTDGWLPDGGFNVYRSDRPRPLNSAPLGATTSVGGSKQIDIGGAQPFQLGKLLDKARQSPPTSSLPPLALVLPKPASSEAAFDRLATPASTISSTPATTAGPAVAPQLAAHTLPAVPATQPTLAETTVASRRALILGAALHPAVGDALGLSFDDSTVTPGQSYTYTLRPISSGVEGGVIATVTLTVPTDASALKPPPPTELRAVQTGPDTVALRWKRLSPDAEAAMGVAKYDVYRRRENSKQQKLNSVPVLVVDIGTPGAAGSVNNLHEPKAFFTDTTPIVGRVEYQLLVTDMFGRTSDPATVVTNVADLHKPRAVQFAAAQLQVLAGLAARKTYKRTAPFHIAPKSLPPQTVLIAWEPGPDAGVSYRIYRADTEQPAQAPHLLTAAPITGSASPATALPSGGIIDSLAVHQCVRLAHSGNLSSLAFSQNSGQTVGRSSHSIMLANCNLAPLSPADRAQVEQTLLSSTQVLTWTDSTAQKDHYYRYYVASVFSRNMQQATPIESNILAYPDLTPPAMPTAATASFQAVPAVTSTAGSTGSAGSGRRSSTLPERGAGRHLTLTDWSGPLVKAKPRDTGGTMVLTWKPGPGAAKYEIYRANVTRITLPRSATPPTVSSACSSASGNSQPPASSQSTGGNLQPAGGAPAAATLAGHSASIRMAVCFRAPTLASITWQLPPKDSDFVLLGTANTTEYDDALSRSSAHYYQYRIVPVNRWNVPGPMATVDARAPATQPPAPPKLLVGAASPDGGAQVEFLPDSDAGDEVVRYELWRSPLLSGASSQSSNSGESPSNARPEANAASSPAPSNSTTGTSPTTKASISAQAGATSPMHSTTASGGKLTTIAHGPSTTQLAGVAARYGVTLHQPILAAASRAGTSIAAAMQSSIRQGHVVATINSANLSAGSNNGAWLTDNSSDLDWRKDYAYVIKAIDKDGLESTSEPVDLTPLKVKAGAPANVTASLNAKTCAVDVAWQSTDPETAGFAVERQLLTPSGGAAPSLGNSAPSASPINAQGPNHSAVGTHGRALTSLPPIQFGGPLYVQLSQLNPATAYTDPSVFPDNSYVYRVRTVDKAGNVSAATVGQSIAIPDGCGSSSPVRQAASNTGDNQTRNPAEPPAQPVEGGSPQAPTISAQVAPAAIPINGVTTLTFRIENPSSLPVAGMVLTSSLPGGLIVALPSALVNNCAGKATATPWMNSIALTGGTVPPNSSCTISVNVTGSSAGQKQVNALLNYSGGSPRTSDSTIITVQPKSPTPSSPAQPQPKQPQPAVPTPRKVVPA
jgi:hypothetical protein